MGQESVKRKIKSRFTAKEAEKNALDFVRYLRDDRNLPIESAWLFGSYAKGKQREWSDVDVCVVSPFFEGKDALSYLWRARRTEDVHGMIEPVGFSPADFFEDTPGPLVHEIRTTGKKMKV